MTTEEKNKLTKYRDTLIELTEKNQEEAMRISDNKENWTLASNNHWQRGEACAFIRARAELEDLFDGIMNWP